MNFADLFEALHGAQGVSMRARMPPPPSREEVDEMYALLGLTSTATSGEIRKAYRKLALRKHPDRGGDPEEFQHLQHGACGAGAGVGGERGQGVLRSARHRGPSVPRVRGSPPPMLWRTAASARQDGAWGRSGACWRRGRRVGAQSRPRRLSTRLAAPCGGLSPGPVAWRRHSLLFDPLPRGWAAGWGCSAGTGPGARESCVRPPPR